MEKKKIKLEDAVKEIRNLFNITENSKSRENKGVFSIDKEEFERDEVISMLKEYFNDKYLDGGMCEITPLTLKTTIFKIKTLPA